MKHVRDEHNVVHSVETWTLGAGMYDEYTTCGESVTTVEFRSPTTRGFAWAESSSPVTCIACLGGLLCSSR